MQSNLRARLPYLVLASVVLVLDRVSKMAVTARYELGQPFSVIDGAFNITYVRNTGVAFGILVASIAAVVVIVFSFRNSPSNRRLQGALGLILAGALGNLYDRMNYGYVIDFLELHARGFYWPSFNVADTAISIGVLLLAWERFRNEAPGRA